MNAGDRTLRWLFDEHLQVDRKWSESTPKGFRWWADHNAQTIEVIGTEEGPEGTAYLVSVRTDFLRSVEPDDASLAKINAVLMSFASLAGPVYDPDEKTLMLASLVRVHDGIFDWAKRVIGMAAVIQVGEARIAGPLMAQTLGAQQAMSGHPTHGFRPIPDELAEIIATTVAPHGKEPSRWSPAEFQDTVDRFLQGPPSVMATGGGPGLTAEFPYGAQSSLLQMQGDQPHPRYGNGLFLLQSFPVAESSVAEGTRLALQLNASELAGWGRGRAGGYRLTGYGLGSYVYRDRSIHFTAFFPNLMYAPGLLTALYYACAWRAEQMDMRLTGRPWTEASFSPSHASIFRGQTGGVAGGSRSGPPASAPPGSGHPARAAQAIEPEPKDLHAEPRRSPCDTRLELVGVGACIDGVEQVFDEHFHGQRVKRITKAGRSLEDLDCVLLPESGTEGNALGIAVLVGSHLVGHLSAKDAAAYHSHLARLAREDHLLASGAASIWAQLQDNQRVKARVVVQFPPPTQFEKHGDVSSRPPMKESAAVPQPGPQLAPSPPAGWYPDPTDRRALCWWDGSRWLPETKHFSTPASSAQPQTARERHP